MGNHNHTHFDNRVAVGGFIHRKKREHGTIESMTIIMTIVIAIIIIIIPAIRNRELLALFTGTKGSKQ